MSDIYIAPGIKITTYVEGDVEYLDISLDDYEQVTRTSAGVRIAPGVTPLVWITAPQSKHAMLMQMFNLITTVVPKTQLRAQDDRLEILGPLPLKSRVAALAEKLLAALEE